MFRLRPARSSDLDALLALAVHLDSPNLPADREFLRGRLLRAEAAFAGGGPPCGEREYQFALDDESGRVVGTSAVLSKHGTPEMPHTFLQVEREERYAESIDKRAEHVTFRLGVCSDGPSELGSLILEPDARARPGKPGKLCSWGRFAFIATHRERFCATLLAEMRAALDSEGRSAFWDAFGQRFTGMSYEEADKRSALDKDFILELFPRSKFYAALLEPELAVRLGEVHDETLPAVRLLEQAGLQWNGHIDPFDAGPFYSAATDDVLPIRLTRRVELSRAEPDPSAHSWIASAGSGENFRAVLTAAHVAGDECALPAGARERLGSDPGDRIWLTPLPESLADASEASRRGDG
jgi:arginine N-succinyltransferase